MRNSLMAVLLAALVALPPIARAEREETFALGRASAAEFERGETEALWARMAAPMRAALGDDAAKLAEFQAGVLRDLGPESALVAEDVGNDGASRTYIRDLRRARSGTIWRTAFAFDDAGAITGFFIKPAPDRMAEAAPTSRLGYETRARLRLPFDGEWFVVWGGRSLDQNQHAASPDQRFAYDFVVRRDGATHRGDGRTLSDYHCFERPILAPAAGTVVVADDGLPDQPIGSTDRAHPAGNHVVLDLGGGEFALLAHLEQGSIAVARGARVVPGQVLGRCGNSGNTSEPHLHFHLQDRARFGAADAAGLPAAFVDYLADGEPVARGEPVRGQVVASAAR